MKRFQGRGRQVFDSRSPMLRLLQDGLGGDGLVRWKYHQQWKTLEKAKRDGYLDDSCYITELGKAFLAGTAKEDIKKIGVCERSGPRAKHTASSESVFLAARNDENGFRGD